jgi:archaellum component FlaF (FlaF/FlaG flagellin family)
VLASGVSLNPTYDPVQDNNDMALVWLNNSAPVAALRYDLYCSSDELGQTMAKVDHGLPGTQFTGVRSDSNQSPSVDNATRNGTATAGQDYVAVNGKLVLYPNENQAVIPIEIIGDTTPEADETFYLDVTNPVGGSFGAGVVVLTAVRTILNDDGGIFA